MNKTQKQAMSLIATLVMTFIVLFFANHYNVDSFWLNPILIFTILTLKNKNKLQKILGLTTFVIFITSLFLKFTYIGFISTVANLVFISAIGYIYDDDAGTFFSNLQHKQKSTPGRYKAIVIGIIMLILSMIPYTMVDALWNGTILETGGKTAIIYGLALICEYIDQMCARNAAVVEEYKREREIESTPVDTTRVIQFLAVWLLILDLSIFGYMFSATGSGYNIFLITTLVTMVSTALVLPSGNKDDVLAVVYGWLRPFQPVALLALLIAHEKALTLNMIYVAIALLIYMLYMIRIINMKASLILTSFVLLLPFVGFVSNPYRHLSTEKPNISDVLLAKDGFAIQYMTTNDLISESKKLHQTVNQTNTGSSNESRYDEQLKRMNKIAEKVNRMDYYTSLFNRIDATDPYLFYKLSVESDGPNHLGNPRPVFVIDITAKNTANKHARAVDIEGVKNYMAVNKDAGKLLFSQLLYDGAIGRNELVNGIYELRYQLRDENNGVYYTKSYDVEIENDNIRIN